MVNVLTLRNEAQGAPIRPLQVLHVDGVPAGAWRVLDARDQCLAQGTLDQPGSISWRAGGVAGLQRLLVEPADQFETVALTYRLEPATRIEDATGEFEQLLGLLLYTCSRFSEGQAIRWNGRIYRFFVRWLRDHVHTLKGMKYFASELKTGIDLYTESQREDGMIWDNLYDRTPDPNPWDLRFREGDYIRPFEDRTAEFKRIPVENDVEYLFVEGVYFTWKATADDGWMAQTLDACIRALNYSRSDRVRWSRTYQLLKRGPTIDTWDFQHSDDCVAEGDPMRIDPDRTPFGVMFGDNTGYFMACRYLAEMLRIAGRESEADPWLTLADEVQDRLTQLSWNGRFFTHWVPEDPDRPRNLGVDPLSQVSLSNAYSLNRGIRPDQAQAILETYRQLSRELPPGSPGEWYTIYPPFGHGYGFHNGRWQYMNGGVTPIVAGELARGAFVHGRPEYGVDILRRLIELGGKGKTLACTYTGAFEPRPTPNFTSLDLLPMANRDSSGRPDPLREAGVGAWTSEGENDLAELPAGPYASEGIPFVLLDRTQTGGRVVAGIGVTEGFHSAARVAVNADAGSVWLLHTTSRTRAGGYVGNLVWEYDDGTLAAEAIIENLNILRWWMPDRPETQGERRMDVGWSGANPTCPYVTLTLAGFTNPHPERRVRALRFEASPNGTLWFIAGATVSDQPGVLDPSLVSYGIPDNWGAAAVIYALFEGLAGIRDTGRGYDRATVQPHWHVAGTPWAEVCAHYPACDGYVAYRYEQHPETDTASLWVTGSGEHWDVNLGDGPQPIAGGVARVSAPLGGRS